MTTNENPIIESKTAAMQRILQLNSYAPWYTTGVINTAKIPSLRAKFRALYGTEKSHSERKLARRHGAEIAYLTIYKPRGNGCWAYWALQVEGKTKTHPAHHRESLKTTEKPEERLLIYDLSKGKNENPERAYVLIRYNGSWTWRMTPEMKKAWKKFLRKAATWPDKHKGEMYWRQAKHSLERVPGHRGVREDAFDLCRYANGLMKRARRDGRALPPIKLPKFARKQRQN